MSDAGQQLKNIDNIGRYKTNGGINLFAFHKYEKSVFYIGIRYVTVTDKLVLHIHL